MGLALGIDAAWTARGSSGVALLECTNHRCRLIAYAPSYAEFINFSNADSVDWRKPAGGRPDVSQLLKAAKSLGGAPVDVVAIDMPMSRIEISARRPADDAVSCVFGKYGASTHSPTPERPGEFGAWLTQQFLDEGFSLRTDQSQPRQASLIEVYPSAALIRLMEIKKRLPYKVSRSGRYWKKTSVAERIKRLRTVWGPLIGFLGDEIAGLEETVPSDVQRLNAMKPHEDVIDAVISAYVGVLFVNGMTEPHGDADSAIWVPKIGGMTLRAEQTERLSTLARDLSAWELADAARRAACNQ